MLFVVHLFLLAIVPMSMFAEQLLGRATPWFFSHLGIHFCSYKKGMDRSLQCVIHTSTSWPPEFRAGKAYVQPWRESNREEGGFSVILAFIFATTRKGWIEACNVRFVPPHPGRRVSSGQGLHAALERERAIEREGRREEESGGGWGVGEIK
jgi:hypothetical protein